MSQFSNYSDDRDETIDSSGVRAICPACGRKWIATAEDAIGEPQDQFGAYLIDDLCSELPYGDTRSDEWF